MVAPRLLFGFLLQTLSPQFILKSFGFSALFLSLSLILVNLLNFISIGTSNYPIFTKLRILWILFLGSFQTVSGSDLFLLVLISLLFGLNLALVIEKYKFVKKQSNLKITLGTGIISLAAAGCASCGLSVASLIGLGTALAVLPFGGVELYIGAIIILTASLFYNLNSLYRACKLK